MLHSAVEAPPFARSAPERWSGCPAVTGGKGPRVYDWAAAELPANIIFAPDPPTHHRWVMARCSLSDPGELAHYLVHAPVELARVAGSRRAGEECFTVPHQGRTGCQWDLFPHDLPPRSAPIPRLTWH